KQGGPVIMNHCAKDQIILLLFVHVLKSPTELLALNHCFLKWKM
ncbi:hypothetical protein Csa_023935, partial [Cucumis sativus]